MKHPLTLVTFAASCLICLVVSRTVGSHFFRPLSQQTAVKAQIQIPKTVFHTRYDSGQASAQLSLPVRNSGSKRLIIRTREANCDCFLREASILVEPGESKNLPLRFPMNALVHCSQIDLMLITNDPQRSTVPVTIRVENSLPSIPANAFSVLEQSAEATPALVPDELTKSPWMNH